jgi:orotate phosphoribosyltransferase
MASTPDLERRLRELLRERSIARGDFVLASGKRSSFYIDARRTTMSGEGFAVIGALGLARLEARGWTPALVGGLTLGADPVAYAIAAAAHAQGRSLDAFSVRKQAKAHGTARRIEGCFAPGATVVVVEDVITTGRSAAEAIAAVTAEGGRVLGVLAVVDREEGGRSALERAGHAVETLVTTTDLGLA